MDPESLRQAVEHAGIAAIGIGFLAGLVFSFNPVAIAAIPVSLAYVTKGRAARQAFQFGSLFVIGIIATHAILGLLAGLGGQWVESLVGRRWGLVLGPLLILLGLMWPGWIRLPLPRIALRATRPASVIGALLLGAAFSIAICPVCTPALVVLLGVAAGFGSPIFGLLLLLAFALGRAIPIAAGAFAVGWFENLRRLAAYRRVFDTAGGVTLIASGLYMLNAYFLWLPDLAA